MVRHVVINDQALIFKRQVRLDLEYVEEGTDGVAMGLIEQGTDWSAVVKAPLSADTWSSVSMATLCGSVPAPALFLRFDR